MTLLTEIAIVTAMIAAIAVAAGCLVYLLALTVLEQYVLRTERNRRAHMRSSQDTVLQSITFPSHTALRHRHA
jgi:hypothetical protein